jgi:hypothetical protein
MSAVATFELYDYLPALQAAAAIHYVSPVLAAAAFVLSG